MDPETYESLTKQLKADFALIKKGRAYYLLGGVLAGIGLVLGLSWSAAFWGAAKAISKAKASVATERVLELEDEANRSLSRIRTVHNQVSDIEGKIRESPVSVMTPGISVPPVMSLVTRTGANDLPRELRVNLAALQEDGSKVQVLGITQSTHEAPGHLYCTILYRKFAPATQ